MNRHPQTGQDLSARRIRKLQQRILRLKEKLEKYSQLLYTPIMMCKVNYDLKIYAWNEAWGEFAGLSRERTNTYMLNELLHPDDQQLIKTVFEQLREGADFREQDLRMMTGDANYVLTNWHLHNIPSEEGVQGIIKTEVNNRQSTTQSQLAAHKRELQRELEKHKRYEAQLSEQTALLKRSNTELERFAYIAAHDLREPLRNIASHVQILEKNYGQQLDHKAMDHLDYAVRGVKNLEAVIKDLLIYSELGTHHFNTVSLQTQQVLKEELRSFRETVRQNGIHVEIGNLPIIKADEKLMRQLFSELIDNALQHAISNELEIIIKGESQESVWKFGIHDNGPGIRPCYHDRIFTLFQRLSGQDKFQGTGAGLAICKKIVELHGGTIWVESDGHNGSSFYFTIYKNRKPG